MTKEVLKETRADMWLMKQRLSKHQTTGKWLHRNYTKFEFLEKQVSQCSVSLRQKRGMRRTVKTGGFCKQTHKARCLNQ